MAILPFKILGHKSGTATVEVSGQWMSNVFYSFRVVEQSEVIRAGGIARFASRKEQKAAFDAKRARLAFEDGRLGDVVFTQADFVRDGFEVRFAFAGPVPGFPA